MVFSSKIYDQVKEKLDKYLFGFDRDQLNVSLLKGAIKLDGVNIKPNQAEQLLQALSMPFSLKAGTVGQLELKMSLMSMFSSDAGQLEIHLENVFFIVGPSMRTVSNDDSYLKETEQELLEHYDENNAFNIFSNNLKLRKKTGTQSPDKLPAAEETKTEATDAKDAVGLSKEQKDSIKGLTLVIKQLHLRYEDDYYAMETPYSCGVVVDELRIESSNVRLFFEKLSETQFRRTNLQTSANQIVKDFNVQGLRLYWNCLSEMYIPTSLWESTRHMTYQIFEAMDAHQLNDMMQQVFTETGKLQFQFIVTDVQVQAQLHCFEVAEQTLERGQERCVTSLSALVSPVRLLLNAHVLNDFHHFISRIQSQFLLRDLKQYRPHRRPITEVPERLASKPSLRRKRKLIVRDWFFFVVWFVRLRKIIHSIYTKDSKSASLLFDRQYSNLLSMVLNKETTLEEVLQTIQSATSNKKALWPYKTEMQVRLLAAELRLFNEQLFEIKPATDCPRLSLIFGPLACHLSFDGVPSCAKASEERVHLQVGLGSFEVNSFSRQRFFSLVKPKKLTPMMLQKEVVFQQTPLNSNRPQHAGLTSAPGNRSNNLSNPALIRSEYGSQPVHVPPQGPDKSVGQNADTERSNLRHFPNMTSPSRLMIGPKVSTNELTIGPQQRHDRQKAIKTQQQNTNQSEAGTPVPSTLKKSASKDSLMANMLSSMSKIFGGAVSRQTEPPKQVEPERESAQSNHNGQVHHADVQTPNPMQYLQSTRHQPLVSSQETASAQSQPQYRPQPQSSHDLKLKDINRQRGLDALLKSHGNQRSQMRSVAHRSFINTKSGNSHYEKTEQNEESKFSSSVSIWNQPGGDEDLVMDSDVRQINQFNYWIESQLLDTSKNKNRVNNSRRDDPRLNSTTHNLNTDFQSVNTPYNKASFLGGAVGGGSSTLGRLLGSNQKGVAGGVQKIQHQVAQREVQQPAGGSPQLGLSRFADENCNVLPASVAQRIARENLSIVKETLLRFEVLPTTSQTATFSYDLVHERRWTKEVKVDLKFGRVEVTYSHNTLQSICELLIGLKSLPSFRDLATIPDCLLPKGDTILTPNKISATKAAAKERAQTIDALGDFTESSTTTNSQASKNRARQKAKAVTAFVQKCSVDISVSGERLYICLFDDKSRDQLAKLVTPPISMSVLVHPRDSPNEAVYEVFGFQMQQSTDLNLLASFTALLLSQTKFFSSHEAVKKGKAFYDEIRAKYRAKEDERRFITQQVIRRQSNAMKGMIADGLLQNRPQVADCQALGKNKKIMQTQQVPKMKGARKLTKQFAESKQVIKPGECVDTCPEADDRAKLSSMINGGLAIIECPSKALVRESCVLDSDEMDLGNYGGDSDVPVPDLELQPTENYPSIGTDPPHANDTEVSDQRLHANLSRKRLDETPIVNFERFKMRNSQQLKKMNDQDQYSQGFGTFQGDSVTHDKLGDDRDIQGPFRPELHQFMSRENVRPSYLTNNTNLREAKELAMNQAFVQLPQTATQNMIGAKKFSSELGYNVSKSQTTDSAGGEARCNEDESDVQKARWRAQANPAIYCDDQDAPLIKEPEMLRLESGAVVANSSGSSDMNVFDNPSIQADPKLTTQRKVAMSVIEKSAIQSPALPPGLPIGNTRTNDLSQRWKSTRENKNYNIKLASKSSSNSKLFSMKESPIAKKHGVTQNVRKPTPNHMINFQRQMSATNIARGDDSPSIMNQPHQERLNSHSHNSSRITHDIHNLNLQDLKQRAMPQSMAVMQPGKKHPTPQHLPAGYHSQKQLLEAMKQSQQLKQAFKK